MSFLNQSARYIFDKHQLSQLKNVCVVLPSRRAVFYFKQELAQLSAIPFIAPEVLAIDDFVMRMSGVNQIDAVSLLFELYEIFKKYDPEVKFDRFISWAPTLLRDFDTIDQYLVENPKSLFEYMSEAKALARWNLELLGTGKPELEKTQSTDKYFKLFENIYYVYNDLHTSLKEKGLSYRGMAYRHLAESIKSLLIDSDINTVIFEKFYFIGFNALSESEEKIIETLVKTNRAETLWDADSYFMSDKFNHKAGTLLRQYKNSGRFGKWNWLSNDLLTGEKNIQIIGVENASLQAKVAGHIYAEAIVTNPNVSTAIVLCDENLLQPVMYSLDEQLTDFNITMGLSLRGSMLFTLIDAIFELQQNIAEFKTKDGGKFKMPKFSHRHIFKVLNHPFIRRYEQLKYVGTDDDKNTKTVFRKTLQEILSKNAVYLSQDEMLLLGENEPIFKILFSRWGDNSEKALQAFYDLIDELRTIYRESSDAIETEYLYLFLTILHRLEKILLQNKELNLKSFKHFLYELIKQEKIPFSGEPISKLQIMGMLETRCLDFDRVILLSVNEGILPSGKHVNSLIPFDACIEYQLPVHSDQDAVMSYHFFRLLQRAKEIDILYVIPNGEGVGGGGTEKSRFILQIENELVKENNLLKITYPKIEFSNNVDNEVVNKIEIHKTKEILNNISKLISDKGIYPTSLSTYLRCSLQFYFDKIAGISKREEVDENFGADIFGTWIHNTLEKIDKDFGPKITSENIETIISQIENRLDEAYQEKFGGYVVESGMNYLLKQVAEQLLKDFFKAQNETQKFPMEVLEVEKQIVVNFEKSILGKVQRIKIAGRIDRIEREDRILKVIDYKTGKVTLKDLQKPKDEALEEALIDPDKEKLRQLWLYQYLMLKSMYESKGLYLGGERLENYEVKAKIYSFRNLKENLEVNLSFENDPTVFGFIEKSEDILTEIVTEMLNPEIGFLQTDDLQTCERCDFRGICGK
ncbi:PD-(D/E)XK nuclease family protein [Emticicia sp. SJ17W-69]|uniref:PD-(D/E)XK nuclease family protein n=1 Tax=Emticicia sp. SJ17W-69 TaxID=3421657 RepID=UPI003EBA02AF